MIDRYCREPLKSLWSPLNITKTWLEIEKSVCSTQVYYGGLKKGISITDCDVIESLQITEESFQEIKKIEEKTKHDFAAFLDYCYGEIGDSAQYFHRGLTSSDIVDTTTSYLMKQSTNYITGELYDLAEILEAKIKDDFPMIGRTHGQIAEKISIKHKFNIWAEEVKRHLLRLDGITFEGKLSGPVGQAKISDKVVQAVMNDFGLSPAWRENQILQRDRHAHIICCLANIGATIEKIATEIRNLQRPEIGEFEEAFEPGQKGSSAMPHKRNPIKCEQLCGLARVLRGYATTALENVPLWGERDLTHSSSERIIIPDSFMLVHYMVLSMTDIIKNLRINRKRIDENLKKFKKELSSHSEYLKKTKTKGREKAYREVQNDYMV